MVEAVEGDGGGDRERRRRRRVYVSRCCIGPVCGLRLIDHRDPALARGDIKVWILFVLFCPLFLWSPSPVPIITISFVLPCDQYLEAIFKFWTYLIPFSGVRYFPSPVV